MTRCASCGYFETEHIDGRCPVCSCGDAPSMHEAHGSQRYCACGCGVPYVMHIPWGATCNLCAESMPHACIWATWLGAPCPGRRSQSEAQVRKGQWLTVRQGTFKPPAPEDPRRNWRGLQALAPPVKPATDAVLRPQLLPQVPARPPQSPGEFASYGGKQAAGLGRKAVEAGWDVAAYYWRAGDGTEGCAVRLAKYDGRAVAIWKRKPGNLGGKSGWSADQAYMWLIGSNHFPAEITHTELEGMIR